MTSAYLLLVTGSLRSNLSRAKCTAQVGMSYRLMTLSTDESVGYGKLIDGMHFTKIDEFIIQIL